MGADFWQQLRLVGQPRSPHPSALGRSTRQHLGVGATQIPPPLAAQPLLPVHWSHIVALIARPYPESKL